ncbi:hypothetical protein ACLOJK_035824 [Asimina triloba]
MFSAAATAPATVGLGSSCYILPSASKSFDFSIVQRAKWPPLCSSVSRRFFVAAAAEKKPHPSSNLSESETQTPDSLPPPLLGERTRLPPPPPSLFFVEQPWKCGIKGTRDRLGLAACFPSRAYDVNGQFRLRLSHRAAYPGCEMFCRVMNGPIVSVARELGFEGNPLLEGLVVSIFIAGAFIGSLSSGSLVDSLGFQRTFQITAIPLILGALLRSLLTSPLIYYSAQAHSPDEILLGRFLVGLGIGVNTALVPIYISEFTVESPRWLCKVGRSDDAKSVIRNLWGESEVESSIEEIKSVIRNDSNKSSWLELTMEPHRRVYSFSSPMTVKCPIISLQTVFANLAISEDVAFIGGALFFLQQFAGINGVLYFSSLTFHDVGITSSASASFFVGLTNLAGALFALYLMDKQGRKKLIIGSYLGMAAAMFLITYSVSSPTTDEQLSHMLSVLGTLMYIFTFAIGAGPVTGLIIPELSSAKTRAKIMGFSFSVHWVCNFLVGLFFLQLVEIFGVGPVYATFGGVSLLAAIFAGYFLIETKGRSLEEIEMSLFPGVPNKGEGR